jgi:hypothetical protein
MGGKQIVQKNTKAYRKRGGDSEGGKGHAHARNMAARAIRSGKLKRLPCEVCGNLKSHAHHDDYSKPLDVRFLCDPHHREHHLAIRRKYGVSGERVTEEKSRND